MSKILCLHHTDLDGAMSGAIVGYFHKEDEVTYRLYNYGYPLNPRIFKGYDKIYAVDISFNQTDPWVYEVPGLIWIDHHKSALTYAGEHPKVNNLPGLRGLGVGACELTWRYLFPDKQAPKLVKYLSAYDVWDKNRFDWELVEKIQLGTKNEYGISAKDLCNYLKLTLDVGMGDCLGSLRDTGAVILEYLEKTYASKLKTYGAYIPEFSLEGIGCYRVMVLNTPDFCSRSFSSLYRKEDYDFMLAYEICPVEKHPGENIVRVSFYTENPKVDVSKVAEFFGGGGHPGAAGCTIDLGELKNMLKSSMSLKEWDDWLKRK